MPPGPPDRRGPRAARCTAAPAARDRTAPGGSPRSWAAASPGSGASQPASGRPSSRATTRSDSRAGDGPRTTTRRSATRPTSRATTCPAAATARTSAGTTSSTVSAAATAELAAASQLARQVDDDEVVAAPAGAEDQVHRRGRQLDRVAAVPGQQRDAVDARQGGAQLVRARATAGSREVGPAQARTCLRRPSAGPARHPAGRRRRAARSLTRAPSGPGRRPAWTHLLRRDRRRPRRSCCAPDRRPRRPTGRPAAPPHPAGAAPTPRRQPPRAATAARRRGRSGRRRRPGRRGRPTRSTSRTRSAPTSTSGAATQDPRAATASGATSVSTPAAAASRSRSSSSTGSPVRSRGRTGTATSEVGTSRWRAAVPAAAGVAAAIWGRRRRPERLGTTAGGGSAYDLAGDPAETCDGPRRGGERGPSAVRPGGDEPDTGCTVGTDTRHQDVPEGPSRQTMRAPGRADFAVPMLDLWPTTICPDRSLPRPPDGGLLRPRQDDHREVEHAGVQPLVLPGRADQPPRRAAQRVRPVRLPGRRRRPRPDGADARSTCRRCATGWDVQQVKDIVAETLHELIDPIIYDEAATLIEEHHLAGRDVVIVSTSGAEVVEPIGEMLGADHVIATRMVVEDGRYTGEIEYYAYGETKAEAIRELAETAGLRPVALLRLQRLGDRPADARGRRPPVTPSTPTGRCARRRVAAGLAGAGVHPAGAAARPVHRREPARSRPRWPRSRWAPAPRPPASCGSPRAGEGAARAAAAACRSGDTPALPSADGKYGRSAPSPGAPSVALHLWVKHGSWAPTRRPAHVRAGEPG